MAASEHSVYVHAMVSASPVRAWDAWADAVELNRWFTTNAVQEFRVGGRYENGDHDCGTFLAIEPMSRIRFTWEQKIHHPGSEVEVRFLPRGDGECEVQIVHEKLAAEKEVADLTEGWTWALDSLKSYLETGRAIGFDEWKADRE